MIFEEAEAEWKSLQNTYQQEFSYLVFGTLPEHALILETLLKINNRLSDLTWDIEIENGNWFLEPVVIKIYSTLFLTGFKLSACS